jgi:tetratricopeptide (TPR) repeat protein
MIVYGSEYEDLKTTATKLEDFLTDIGIKSFSETQNFPSEFPGFINQPLAEGVDKVLYIVSDEGLLRFQADSMDASKKQPIDFHPTLSKINNKLFVLQNKKETTPICDGIGEVGYIALEEGELCYVALINLLRYLLPGLDWQEIDLKFKWQGDIRNNLPKNRSFPLSPKEEEEPLSKHRSRVLVRVLKNRRNIFIFSLFVMSGVLLILGVFKFLEPPHKPSSPSIRSDLVIPVETSLLNRPELLKKIEEKLEGEEGIQTVALVGIVGMGGVGKTTLARHFGSLHQASVVWEINAETSISLANSFKDLATKLATTDELKRELNILQKTENAEEKEKKLLAFVKSRLKESPNWLLIYDNVENLSILGSYLPQDANVWGKTGKVILTTRNANLKEHHFIKPENIIHVDELTTEEGLTLFSKIQYGCDPKQLSSDQKEEVLIFLKNIPPFPLDVSVAAYYIKNNNLTCQQYLERIAGFDQHLETSQKEFLKQIGTYEKTRYSIITSSLAKIIETNKEFEELLLFISLLESQNIPRSLLESYKNPAIVDAFIQELKKYSLITAESAPSPSQPHAFSIHRSSQAILLSYLTKVLDLEHNQNLIQQVSISFENYIDKLIKREDFFELKFFIGHCEAFCNHSYLLTDTVKWSMKGEMGCIYYCLGDNEKAEHLLRENLENLNKLFPKNYVKIAQFLLHLGNAYNELGDHQKAKALLEESLVIYKKQVPEDPIDIAWVLTYLGRVDTYLGDYQQAKDILEQSLAIYKQHGPEDHIKIAKTLTHLAYVYKDLGEYEKAKDLLEQSLSIYEKQFTKNHIRSAWVLISLGGIHRELGNYEKAKDLIEQGLLIYKENLPENHSSIAWVLNCLGNVYRDLKDYPEAQRLIKQSLAIREQHFGKNHIRTALTLRDLGVVYLEEGQLKTTEELLVKALAIFQNSKHPYSYTCLESLAELYLQKAAQSKEPQQFKAQAIDYLKQALTIIKEHFPADSPHLIRINTKLKELSQK